MTSLEDVLARGYLPKELPLGFGSTSFGRLLATAAPPEFIAGGKARMSVRHGLARPGTLVRTLSMPDPVHFYRLADLITSEWGRISTAMSSPYSLSQPIDDPRGNRAWTAAEQRGRADARAEHAARARFRITADVSQFYPSIYTHVLDWAIRGKAVAKAKRATSGLGPLLDSHTRNGQDRQSIGIPIGPDTSLVLAELVLARVDEDVAASARGIHGFRYYDDYELFTASRTQADRAISRLTSALANWQLILNPHKVSVEELPVPVEDEWVSSLKRIRLGDHPSSQRSGLTALFDEATRLARRYPRDPVLAYALGIVISRDGELRHRPHRSNWSYLQDLLLQAALGEPGLLPRIGILVQWARLRGWPVPQKSLEPALNLLVREAARRGHASEVAWGTWLAIRLQIPLRATTASSIATLVDDAVAIVALDARDQGVIGSLDVSNWAPLMTRESLTGDHWLLAYEAHVHGWLPSADRTDYIGADAPFAHLRRNQVRFYDESAEIPIPVMRPAAVRTEATRNYLAVSVGDEEPSEQAVYDG